MAVLERRSEEHATPHWCDAVLRESLTSLRTVVVNNKASIAYSDPYHDGHFKYRHVVLPPAYDSVLRLELLPLLAEWEYEYLGIKMSPGWEHFLLNRAQPSVLLFRRVQ